MRPDVNYVRNGDVSLAYQVVGNGSHDVLLVSGFVSNLEYTWEYPSLAHFLTRLAEGPSSDPHRSSRFGTVRSLRRGAITGDHAP